MTSTRIPSNGDANFHKIVLYVVDMIYSHTNTIYFSNQLNAMNPPNYLMHELEYPILLSLVNNYQNETVSENPPG